MKIYGPKTSPKTSVYLYLVLFVVFSSVFLGSLFVTTTIVLNQYSLLAQNPSAALISSLDSYFRNYLAATTIVTFPIAGFLLLLLRADILKSARVQESEGFKLLYPLSFVVPTVLIVGYLAVITAAVLGGTFSSALLLKFTVLILFVAPTIIFLKSLAVKPPSFSATVLWLFYYLSVSVLVSVFAFTEIASPRLAKNLQADQNKIIALTQLSNAIQDYYYQFKKLPGDLDEIKNDYSSKSEFKKTVGEYEYSVVDDKTYEICSSFNFSSDELREYGFPVDKKYSHSKGQACFSFTVASEFCKTLGTKMIVGGDGRGEIGCDIQVNGAIDLKESYCEGQSTLQKEFLVPDAYGRKNRYYATLTGLNMDEEARVFAYTQSGLKIECLPPLNK